MKQPFALSETNSPNNQCCNRFPTLIMTNLQSGYYSSVDKDTVREHFDLPLLVNFSQSKQKKLKYFGMPGAECLDLQTWSEVIDQVDAVERHPRNLRSMRRFLERHFSSIRSRFHYGDVDDIILNDGGNPQLIGSESYRPRVGSDYDESLQLSVWDFDVVYLDYFGSFLPALIEEFPLARNHRADALLRLFAQDRIDSRDSWLLLLTVEAEQYGEADIDFLMQYIDAARSESSADVVAVLDDLSATDAGGNYSAAKLVHGTMALMVSNVASSSKLEVQSRGTVFYTGANGKTMVHMAFQLEPTAAPLGSYVSRLPLLQAPMLRPTQGTGRAGFDWVSQPFPGTTRQSVRTCLGFLDQNILGGLLNCVPG